MDRYLTPSKKRLLSSFYFNSEKPGAYSGFQKLWKALEQAGKDKEFTKAGVRKWLNAQESYSVHKPIVRKFKRRRVYVESINEQFEADLMVLTDFASENDGYKYVLTCIDVFSKYAWALPLKSKRPLEVETALQSIFREEASDFKNRWRR